MTTVILDENNEKANKVQIEYVKDVLRIASDYQKRHKFKRIFEEIEETDPNYYNARRDYLLKSRECVRHKKEMFYGGGIRGGKSVGGMAILVILCKMFPKSKWLIVRKDMSTMQLAVASMTWVLGTAEVYWKRSAKETFVQFSNGSRIIFYSENYKQDKDLTKFLGLEINGVLFEQLEEITKKGYNIIKSRVGSWYKVEGAMPPPLILGNFNPTFGWVKKEIYNKWRDGKLEWYRSFTMALAKDNPHVTSEQWQMWDTLDEETKAMMIHGQWDIEVKSAFLYAFKRGRNTRTNLQIDPRHHIWLSFDFNVDPMTCSVCQTDGRTFFRVIKSFKIPNSDTYDICRYIKPLIKGREHLVKVTGDASGRNRISGARAHMNHYQIIAAELGLKEDQFKLMGSNPGISENRVLMNSLCENFPEFVVDESLTDCIEDLEFTTTSIDREGRLQINKTGVNEYLGIDNRLMGHTLDNIRYCATINLHKWVNIPKS
jgi:hypothetical protein